LQLAGLIHKFSGAAASDNERAFYRLIAPGNDENLSQILAKSATIKDYLQRRKRVLNEGRSIDEAIAKVLQNPDVKNLTSAGPVSNPITVQQAEQAGFLAPPAQNIKTILDPDNPNQVIKVKQLPDGSFEEVE
jgi:hypothetical protein